MSIRRTYSELIMFSTFKERFEYLKLGGRVGEDTFGYDRYINQMFYRSVEWRNFRHSIIARDLGCDLGIPDQEIYGMIIIHHMNPITKDILIKHPEKALNSDEVVCVSDATHKALHYGDSSTLLFEPIIRRMNDTCPWKEVRSK